MQSPATPSRLSSPITLQVLKYLACGFTAFCFHQLVVYSLGYTLNPAFDNSLGDQIRFQRSVLNNSIAFLVSNSVAYLLNIRFVFQSGRHHRHHEILLFFVASALGFFPALFSLDLVIRTFSLNTHLANIAFATTAAAGNFLARANSSSSPGKNVFNTTTIPPEPPSSPQLEFARKSCQKTSLPHVTKTSCESYS